MEDGVVEFWSQCLYNYQIIFFMKQGEIFDVFLQIYYVRGRRQQKLIFNLLFLLKDIDIFCGGLLFVEFWCLFVFLFFKIFLMKIMFWMFSFVFGFESIRSRFLISDFFVVLLVNLFGFNSLFVFQNGRQYVLVLSILIEISFLIRQNFLFFVYGQGF